MEPLTPGITMVAAAITPTPKSFSTFTRLKLKSAALPSLPLNRVITITTAKKAKKAIRQAVLNIVDKNSQFSLRKNSKRAGAGATVIYMIGPSGVGKTMIADICRAVLAGSGATPLVIEASDIDRRSRMSPVEQLFGMRSRRTQNGGETFEYSPIIQRLFCF